MTNVQGCKSARPDGTVVQREDKEKWWGEVGGVVVVQFPLSNVVVPTTHFFLFMRHWCVGNSAVAAAKGCRGCIGFVWSRSVGVFS